MRTLFPAAVLTACVASFSGAAASPAPAPASGALAQAPQSAPTSTTPAKADARVVSAHAAFAFDLLHRLAAAPGENVFFSPSSISMTLELTLNGATGETREEMRKALRLDKIDIATVNAANAILCRAGNQKDPKVSLSIGNSVWLNSAYTLEPSFIELGRSSYDAKVANLDFRSSASRVAINAEVSRQTNRRIRNLIGPLDRKDVTILVNAVVFDGKWTRSFDLSLTADASFNLSDGSSKTVPMMHATGSYAFTSSDGVQAVRLPYGSGRFAMYVLLPAERDGLAGLIAALDSARFNKLVGTLETRPGSVSMPRFRVECGTALNDALQAAGMKRAFIPLGEFTGISPVPQLFIRTIVHRAVVDVDESGTKAAAVTSMRGQFGGAEPEPEPFTMVVDHPFLCAIRDDQTGEILFLGAIYNPA